MWMSEKNLNMHSYFVDKMEKSTDSDESVETDQSKEKETNPGIVFKRNCRYLIKEICYYF